MPAYLVAYDLVGSDATSEACADLRDAIQAFGDAHEIERSVWIVNTKQSAHNVFHALWEHMQDGDRLRVIRATAPATLQSPHTDWFRAVLR